MTKFLPLIVLSFLFLSCKQKAAEHSIPIEQSISANILNIDSPRVKTIYTILSLIKSNEPGQAMWFIKNNMYTTGQQQQIIEENAKFIASVKIAINHYGIPPVNSWKIEFDTTFYPYGSVPAIKAPALAIYEVISMPLHTTPDNSGIPPYLLFTFCISDPKRSPAFIDGFGFSNDENVKISSSISGRADSFLKTVNGSYTDEKRVSTCRDILNKIQNGQLEAANQVTSNIEYQYPDIDDYGPALYTNNGNDKTALLYIQSRLKACRISPENEWDIKLDTVFYKVNTANAILPVMMISEFVDVPLCPKPGSVMPSDFLRFIFDRTDPNAPPTIINRITIPPITLVYDTRTRFVCDVIN